MRVCVRRGLLCCGLVLGVGSGVLADPGDVYQGGANFIAAQKMKARDTPVLRAVLAIPPDIKEGDVFVVNCLVQATKNSKGAPTKGASGSAAAFANQLDVGAGSWAFFGLVGSGIPFTTQKDGSAGLTTGPVTAGAWANVPGANDSISISATFTNGKRVVKTEFGCEIVVGAAARASSP